MKIEKITMTDDYSASQAAELLGMSHQEVIRRLRRGDIKGRKVGWFWIISGQQLLIAKNSNWYRNRKK